MFVGDRSPPPSWQNLRLVPGIVIISAYDHGAM